MTGKALEFLYAALRIVTAGQPLQVVANQLIETLTESIGFLPGACH